DLPSGRADDSITEGCLVLEGGGWRGLYTLGVLDRLMIDNINIRTTIGISAGALSGLGYTVGQIGWGARVDLNYRHDPRYCGVVAMLYEKGIMGYRYLFNRMVKDLPLDKKRLRETPRKLFVGVTNLETGGLEFFEKESGNILLASAASASVPYVTKPVIINGTPYLDGGCAEKIPYHLAKEMNEQKIIVVKTRERGYRRKKGNKTIPSLFYHKYPRFAEAISQTNEKFNLMMDELEEDEKAGKVFVVAPTQKVEVSRFERDMEKLGELYWQGYRDVDELLPELKEYLGTATES
ncbi:MAG: patatin family protein, partial [Lachnospiraceae bacterium]|nr:patatin family protein [Lachnospiraceae bacterium]